MVTVSKLDLTEIGLSVADSVEFISNPFIFITLNSPGLISEGIPSMGAGFINSDSRVISSVPLFAENLGSTELGAVDVEIDCDIGVVESGVLDSLELDLFRAGTVEVI